MNNTASVPGKTFFVGEYLALNGGPSILLTTDPRFSMTVRPAEAMTIKGLPPGSPASNYINRYASEFANYWLEFEDPHVGRGGLGASSAQFAMLVALRKGWPSDIGELLRDYRACAWSGEGTPPSGADVIAQLAGGLVVYDGQRMATDALHWGFPELGLTLLRTGQKIATHEHLRVAPELSSQEAFRRDASDCVRATMKAFKATDGQALVREVRSYDKILRTAGLTCLNTLSFLDEMSSMPWALAAKGCGALGADVILVVHPRDAFATVFAWGAARGLNVCGGIGDEKHGLRVAEGLTWRPLEKPNDL